MSEVSTLRMLVPLPKTNWGGCCALCDKPQARWTARGLQAPLSVCSLCILYASAWGRRNELAIAKAIGQVEAARSQPMPRNAEKLMRCEDADSVLGVLVLVDRTLTRMPQ